MMQILDFTQSTTYELTPSSNRLPPFIWTAFTALNKVHGMWRWYRRVELYSNQNNLTQLLAGHFIDFTIGDRLMVRIAAQCLLISTRILQCVQQQEKLWNSCQKWWQVVRGYYPSVYKRRWTVHHTSLWISPSSAGWLQAEGNYIFDRIKKVVECTAIIFFNCFKLSMNIMDVMDAFNLSPSARSEGINEFFINGMKWLDTLSENKEELLDGIKKNRVIIEKILYKSPFNYDSLETSVRKTLEKTEIVATKAKQISNLGNGAILECGKRALLGVRTVTGI